MIVSTRLLRQIIEFPYSVEELSKRLTSIGIEVEGIRKVSPQFSNTLTGRIEKIETIPDTRLFKVTVNIDKEFVEIVSAATNLKEKNIVPVALPGSKIATGITIKAKDFQEIKSYGMLCSYSELGIDSDVLSQEEKEGIFTFPEATPIGKQVEEILPIEDELIELSLLPDRADAFYVMGVARWIEVLLAKDDARKANFKKLMPEIALDTLDKTDFPLEIEDRNLCDVYSARIIRSVEVKKSSIDLRKQLFMLRIRPINNIVDITNYIAKLYGQPLHSFDLDKLDGKIVVRNARKGEKIRTLDGIERTLDNYHLVIADNSKPVAIAGVMGGEETSVTETTRNILLESAHFNPTVVSKSSRTLSLITDASTLFEKGTDPKFPSSASKLAAHLIKREANGNPYEENLVDLSKEKDPINVRFRKINSLLGTAVGKEEVFRCLSYEGIDYSENGDSVKVYPLSFRQDLNIEEDVIEEIVRIKGYNEFGEIAILSNLRSGSRTEYENFIWDIKDLLVKLGLTEVSTSSLANENLLKKTKFLANNLVRILNPLTEDISILRPDLFPMMFSVLERNINMQNTNLSLFEIGNVFLTGKEKPLEYMQMGIMLCGDRIAPNGLKKRLPYDLLYLKGLIETILDKLSIEYTLSKADFDFLHPYQSALVYSGNELLGYFGQINNELMKEAFFATLNIEKLFALRRTDIYFKNYSIFPSVKRDIAILVNTDVPEIEVRDAIRKLHIPELKKIELFDVYEGSPLPENKKNLAYSLEFSSLERTLTSEEVEKYILRIEDALQKQVKGVLRRK